MKRVILLISCLFILVGCAKTNDEYRVETELERFKIKEILLKDIEFYSDDYNYALGVNDSDEEVIIKYKEKDEVFKIIEVKESVLNFSYRELVKTIKNLENKNLKNAILAIINNSELILVSNNSEIMEVLKKDNSFNSLVFFYRSNNKINRYVFTYDLGDYYFASETKKEIYYPIYCKYEDFP